MAENSVVSELEIDIADTGVAKVTNHGTVILYVNQNSRDAIVAANAFLNELLDKHQEMLTKDNIYRVMRHLSDMCYGFEREDSDPAV